MFVHSTASYRFGIHPLLAHIQSNNFHEGPVAYIRCVISIFCLHSFYMWIQLSHVDIFDTSTIIENSNHYIWCQLRQTCLRANHQT